VTQWLGLAGFETLVHERAVTALGALGTDFPGVLVTDLKMEGMDGMELLQRSQQLDPELPVVVITGHGDVETAVEAMRLGAYDFIEKPFAPERFLEVVRRASEKRALVIENRRLRRAVSEQTLSARIIGTSRAAEALRANVASSPAPMRASCSMARPASVGSVARCLHDFSRRAKSNYVASIAPRCRRPCSRASSSGTRPAPSPAPPAARGQDRARRRRHLFLDEIDSMPLATQAKLLRALQEHLVERLGSNRSIPVDLRAIAASKADLRALSAEGRFRLDSTTGSVVELVVPCRCASDRGCAAVSDISRAARQKRWAPVTPDRPGDHQPAHGA
jgi:two-component system C4-dicarboxylate transport response regulator DctD